MNDHRRDALLKEYGEVSNNFRLLTDIRFRMLAFLPVATGAAAAVAVVKGDAAGSGIFSLALFGLAATIGLATYNARNDQLYDELVGRAASIERSLDLADGGFANRPRPWLTLRLGRLRWKIDHRTGIATIYAASIALWLTAVLAPILEVGRRAYLHLSLPHFMVPDPSAWVNVIALLLAITVTGKGAGIIKAQKKVQSDFLRTRAADAVNRARALEPAAAATDPELIRLCVDLSGENAQTIQARAAFYASLEPASRARYLPQGSSDQFASHFVALLTDLPPRWLLDCATGRRR